MPVTNTPELVICIHDHEFGEDKRTVMRNHFRTCYFRTMGLFRNLDILLGPSFTLESYWYLQPPEETVNVWLLAGPDMKAIASLRLKILLVTPDTIENRLRAARKALGAVLEQDKHIFLPFNWTDIELERSVGANPSDETYRAQFRMRGKDGSELERSAVAISLHEGIALLELSYAASIKVGNHFVDHVSFLEKLRGEFEQIAQSVETLPQALAEETKERCREMMKRRKS